MSSNNDMANASVQLDTNPNGTVTFASDVVSTIAGLATTEVEGVASMYAGSTGLVEIFSRRSQANTKNMTRGVRVELDEGVVTVTLTIVVDYGCPVPEVAQGIQENVKKAIETMTGLAVAAVNVHIQGVSFDRENKATAEIEAQQRLMLTREELGETVGEAAGEPEIDEDDGEYELELEDISEEELATELEAEAEPEQETEASEDA